jgi:hypothetical protein
MAGQTPRFDFNFFGGDTDGTLADDGDKFTGEDRLTLDTILAALENHDHRVPSTTSAPVGTPSLGLVTNGGALEGGTTYYYVVSFVNADGLETISSPEASQATPDLLEAPDPPQGETGTAAGTLAPGVYYYALTGIRGDEESALGAPTAVTVLADENIVTLTLPDEGDADTLQIWRQKDTDPGWTRIDTATATFIDDGSVPAGLYGDPANEAPTATTGADDYVITVTLTGADVTAVQNSAGWRIYRSTESGVYSSASLVHEVVERVDELDEESDLLVSWPDDGDAALTGSPKLVSTQLNIPAFSFESATVLPATTGYPLNYPILDADGVLHINRAGTWTVQRGPFESAAVLPATTGYPLNYPIVTTAGLLYINLAGTWTQIGPPTPPELPTGGATGEILAKNSGTDYDVEWIPAPVGGGAPVTIVDTVAGPIVATAPVVEVVHTVSVPANSAIHFTWTFAVKVSLAGGSALAFVSNTLPSYGMGFVERLAVASLANPGIEANGSDIGADTYVNAVIQGVAINSTVAAEDCEFNLEEWLAVGTATVSSSVLAYWIG